MQRSISRSCGQQSFLSPAGARALTDHWRDLADRVGITPANLAVLKNGRAKAVRFATLAALCEVLKCQPGDLLRWEAEDAAAD
ncbi:helix-turn-helix transcriptional regulator [Streptomyces sp. NPDC086182]|uniref:helix-turn-helix domain-containing protein n=1 Tax=Streptomyces sp. NPDC086182 TaxID=3155058 RepID=UPI0034463FE4